MSRRFRRLLHRLSRRIRHLIPNWTWNCMAEGQHSREDEEGSHRVGGSTQNKTRCESDAAHGTPPAFYAVWEDEVA